MQIVRVFSGNDGESHFEEVSPEEMVEIAKRLGEGDRATENGRLDRHRDALRRMVAVRLDPAITGPMDTSNDYAANPRPV